MAKKQNPLNWNVPIVDPHGMPTKEFMQKWVRQLAINGEIPELSTPAQVSALLDILAGTPNDILVRGASLWAGSTPPNDATKFLNGAFPPAWAKVKDSDLSTSDVTTNNVDITKHGFVPKLPNDATKFLDGTGVFSVPSGGGGTDDDFTFLGSFAKWNAAKARGVTAPARCVFIGDSNVVGHGDNGGTDLFTKGFARYFAVDMGWLTGSVFGNQMEFGPNVYEAYNVKMSHSGANISMNTSSDGILGGGFFKNSRGAAGTWTLAPAEVFDTLKFTYPTVPGNDPSVVVKVDGVTVDTVNQNVANSMVVKTYTGLGHTTHTINIVMSGTGASGDGYFMALELQDRTNGTPVYCQAGLGGAKAADIGVSTNPWSQDQQMDQADFDFGFIYCTINDLAAGTAGATYYKNIEKVVKRLAETADGCLMFGFPTDVNATLDGTGVTYAEILRNIAMDYGWSVYDSRRVFGHSYVSAQRLGLNFDTAHPNSTGHTDLATDLFAFIGPSL